MTSEASTKRQLLDAAWDKDNHPCSLRNFLSGCHCKDCIKIYHPEELQIAITMRNKSEYMSDQIFDWLLETGMTAIDSLMYEHWCENLECECSVCIAFHQSGMEALSK